MINKIHKKVNEDISLAEFIDFLDEKLDFENPNFIEEAFHNLARLYNNRTFLKEYIVEGLNTGIQNFENDNRYTPPSLILKNADKYILRANLWRNVNDYDTDDINLYGLAHDHNFDFLTLNYLGPGYKSEMYEYNYDEVVGRIGEKVDLKYIGILSLTEGDMYFYRKNKDIHTQLPPKGPSITINIMAKVDSIHNTRQHLFDTKTKKISNIYGDFYARKHIYDIASLLKDNECNHVLGEIYSKTNCEFTLEHIGSILNK